MARNKIEEVDIDLDENEEEEQREEKTQVADTSDDDDEEGDDNELEPEGGDLADEAGGDDDTGDEDEEGLTVKIGDDDPEDDETDRAPEWVRNMRRENRELKKKLREQEKADEPGAVELREKPTLAGHDYSTEDFEADLAKWYEEKREHDRRQEETQKVIEENNKRWQRKLETYDEGKATLKADDFDDVEDAVREMFDKPFAGLPPTQDMRFNMIRQGAENAPLLIYALGKNPKKAAELAKINDPVEFAFAVAKVEASVQIGRRPKTSPERKNEGGGKGTGAGSTDNKLERLRAKAAETGDFTEVNRYKRKLKAKA